MRELTEEDAVAAVWGGCILGGGGGGTLEEGLEMVGDIFPEFAPRMASIDEIDPCDHIACVAQVGAPSATEASLSVEQLVGSVERLVKEFDGTVAAVMTNENGASTSINGWLQSAALGIPIVDSPANGRAHPTGSMGSMNLSEVPEFISFQSFAGGSAERAISGFVRSNLDTASSAVRALSVQAGGVVGVCRNPVSAEYVRANAANGALTQAIELGKCYLDAARGDDRISNVLEYLGGEVLVEGEVSAFSLREDGGFDVGEVVIGHTELTFWNEYMTVECKGERLATFPDLIMTFDLGTGEPVVSARVREGMRLAVISVPRSGLILSTTMSNARLLGAVEPILGKSVVQFS